MTVLTFQTQIQDLLGDVENAMRGQSRGYHPILKTAIDQLLSSGGKRVRPTVALLVSNMLGVEKEVAVNLGASVELLHTATLVHDDLIDEAKVRRGQPTLNSVLSTPATILTGDFMFAQAAWLGSQVKSTVVMEMFANTLSTIVNGEITQIFERNALTSREIYLNRIYAKTASMFELAASAPAHLAEGAEKFAEPLTTFGNGIGMAFQMVDDILDFSSDMANMGKPVASDLRLGLVTLPALYFLEKNPEDARLITLQKGERLPDEQVDKLVEDIRQSEAMDAAIREAREQSEKAVASLDTLPDGAERTALMDLADYVVERLN